MVWIGSVVHKPHGHQAVLQAGISLLKAGVNISTEQIKSLMIYPYQLVMNMFLPLYVILLSSKLLGEPDGD